MKIQRELCHPKRFGTFEKRAPGLRGKVFDKGSDQKSRMAKGSKEQDFKIGKQAKFDFKTSEDNQNSLMAPLQSKAALPIIKFSSDISSESTTLIKYVYIKLTTPTSR